MRAVGSRSDAGLVYLYVGNEPNVTFIEDLRQTRSGPKRPAAEIQGGGIFLAPWLHWTHLVHC